MMRSLFVLASMLLAVQAWGLEPQQRVENFRLMDHQGGSHELYYFSDARAIVFMSPPLDHQTHLLCSRQDNGASRYEEWGAAPP